MPKRTVRRRARPGRTRYPGRRYYVELNCAECWLAIGSVRLRHGTSVDLTTLVLEHEAMHDLVEGKR